MQKIIIISCLAIISLAIAYQYTYSPPTVKPTQITTPSIPSKTTTKPHNKHIALAKTITHLHSLADCLSMDCGLDTNVDDPRAARLDIGQQIKEILINLKDSDLTETETIEVSQKFIQYPDGHVQEAALDLMAQAPPVEGNVDAIITGLETTDYDALLYQQAIVELSRYQNNIDKQHIEQLIIQTLQTGDITVANTVAKSITPLLTEENYPIYLDVANQLPAQTQKARLLKSSLEAYRLNHEAG